MNAKAEPILSGITHMPGELIGLSSGEYSDYRFNGLYVVKQPIDLGALALEYVGAAEIEPFYADTPEDERKPYMYRLSDSGFGAFLIARGLMDEVPYDEVHCGSYDFEAAAVNLDLSSRRKAIAERPTGASE